MCKEVRNFPGSIHLNSLKFLSISSWSNQFAIKELLKSIKNLTGLNELYLEYCEGLNSLPSSICQLKCLEELSLAGCSNLESFPENLNNMKALRKLYLPTTALKELPSPIGNLSGLVVLCLDSCKTLASLPSSISNLKFLEHLDLNSCPKLESFPETLENMEGLKTLCLNGTTLKELPSLIFNLSGLLELDLSYCENLTSLPSSIFNLKLLEFLNLNGCSKLESFFCCSSSCQNSSCLCNLYSLKHFILQNTNIESIPACIKRLSHLVFLALDDCKRLQSIEEIPQGIDTIDAKGSSLETIKFSSLPVISSSIEDTYGYGLCFNFCNCFELDKWSNILETIFELYRYEYQDSLFHSSLGATGSESQSYHVHEDEDEIEQVSPTGSGSQSYHVDEDEDEIDQEDQEFAPFVSFLAPGSEIPSWFSDHSSGSSITIKVHQNFFNGELIFFYVCAVFDGKEISEDLSNIHCEYNLKTEFCEHSFHSHFQFFNALDQERLLMSDHMFVGSGYFCMWSNNNCSTDVSFQFKVDETDKVVFPRVKVEGTNQVVYGSVKVKECGVKLSFVQDDYDNSFPNDGDNSSLDPDDEDYSSQDEEDNTSPDDEDNCSPVIQPSSPDDFVTSRQDSGIPMEESPITRMKRCRDYSCYAEAEQSSTKQTAQPNSSPLPKSLATYPAGVPTMGYKTPLLGVISVEGNTISSAAT